MRIFLAGGTGVPGARLIPKLTLAGHQVTVTTRRPGCTGAGGSRAFSITPRAARAGKARGRSRRP